MAAPLESGRQRLEFFLKAQSDYMNWVQTIYQMGPEQLGKIRR